MKHEQDFCYIQLSHVIVRVAGYVQIYNYNFLVRVYLFVWMDGSTLLLSPRYQLVD